MKIKEAYFVAKEKELVGPVNAYDIVGKLYQDEQYVGIVRKKILSFYAGKIFFTYNDSYDFSGKDLAADYNDFLEALKAKIPVISNWKIEKSGCRYYLLENGNIKGEIVRQNGNYLTVYTGRQTENVFVNWLNPSADMDIEMAGVEMDTFLFEKCKMILPV